MRLGRVAKLTEEEIEAASTGDWAETGLFDARDAAAILWAERVTRNEAHADPAARDLVREQFDEAELVELTLVICLFNFLNRFNDTTWLELDSGAPPGANLYIPPESFERYAATMYGDAP